MSSKSILFFFLISSGCILREHLSLAQNTNQSSPWNISGTVNKDEIEEEFDSSSWTYESLISRNKKLEAARNRWQETFRDIEKLVVPTVSLRRKSSLLGRSFILNNNTSSNILTSSNWFNEWKLFLKDEYEEEEEENNKYTNQDHQEESSKPSNKTSHWNLSLPRFMKRTALLPWVWNPKKWKLKKHLNKHEMDSVETYTTTTTANSKSLLPKQIQRLRFVDGVTTWDNLLQQWADDATEYFNANMGNYTSTLNTSSMNIPTFHRGKKQEDKTTTTTNLLEVLVSKTKLYDATQKKTFKKIQTFKPRPVIPGEPIVPHTDLSDKTKNIWIVTTAALPWMTGTAVNPLLRAAYLCESRWKPGTTIHHHHHHQQQQQQETRGGNVTLMIPWLEKASDRDKLYGKKFNFTTCQDQEMFIRSWLRHTANMTIAADQLFIEWYVGWLEPLENSVYGMGDITGQIPVERADVVVLEEPEHLNWYRAPGESWTRKFKHVVGIVHTNYFVYAQDQPAALLRVRFSSIFLLLLFFSIIKIWIS